MRNPFHRHRYRELEYSTNPCKCWMCTRCGDRLWCFRCRQVEIANQQAEAIAAMARSLFVTMDMLNEKPPESAGGLGDD